MTMKRTIGGQRLGSGNRMTVDLKTYERSTHDLSYVWRSTQAPGTLVPFMTELGLPGDTFDIDLNCNIMTHPTVGPLFGSYKVQLDVFMTPIRLYNAALHNNAIGIGMNMAQVLLPQIELEAEAFDNQGGDNQQINPSSIFSYLNIRGLGRGEEDTIVRQFNAIPYLAYWDIYKNYYANKQEEIGAVIHSGVIPTATTIDVVQLNRQSGSPAVIPNLPVTDSIQVNNVADNVSITYTGTAPDPAQILIRVTVFGTTTVELAINQLFNQVNDTGFITASFPKYTEMVIHGWRYATSEDIETDTPRVETFPLVNIDQMRTDILGTTGAAFVIDRQTSYAPYSLPLQHTGTLENGNRVWSKMSSQEGLGLKTYQSDLFNNWILTEWLDGTNGISEITSIDTTSGSFSIDTLNLSKKVYDMLNRIAISGGTYDDWLDTVYTHEKFRSAESPMYMGD